MFDGRVPKERFIAALLAALAVCAPGCGTSESAGPHAGPIDDASVDSATDSTGGQEGGDEREAGNDAQHDLDVAETDALDAHDANELDAGDDAGCVDIRVLEATLPAHPDGWTTTGPLIGNFDDRDHVWRDAAGIHVAWNAAHPNGSVELVVSGFDPSSGVLLSTRLFSQPDRLVFVTVGVSDTGVAGLGVGVNADGGGYHALLLIRTDDPSVEELIPLPPWPDPNTILVGVGWDGEAFALHGWASGTQYVTRVGLDGTVLLQPTAFGVAAGYADRIRYATDPVSGVTYAVSEGMWLTGHLRDGTSIPWAGMVTGVQFEPQGCPTMCTGGDRPVIRAFPGGAAIAGSGESPYEYTTFVYLIDQSLKATQDAIAIPGIEIPSPGPTGTTFEWIAWPTLQPLLAGGWWVAGAGLSMIEYVTDASAAALRREIVSFSAEAQAQGHGFDVRFVESAAWGDEVWLGFQDNTNTVGEHAYRVVLANRGCVYRSAMDEQLHP